MGRFAQNHQHVAQSEAVKWWVAIAEYIYNYQMEALKLMYVEWSHGHSNLMGWPIFNTSAVAHLNPHSHTPLRHQMKYQPNRWPTCFLPQCFPSLTTPSLITTRMHPNAPLSVPNRYIIPASLIMNLMVSNKLPPTPSHLAPSKPEVPHKPEDAALMNRLTELFDERPIWLRSVLIRNIPQNLLPRLKS